MSQTSESSTKPAASSRFFASATLDTRARKSKQARDLLIHLPIPGPLNHYFDVYPIFSTLPGAILSSMAPWPGHGMRRRPRAPHEVQEVLGGRGRRGRAAHDADAPRRQL